jgi:cytochrome c-type biogenesis protein CcmH
MTFRTLGCILFVLVVTSAAMAASKPTLNDVAGKLSCFCGTCPHLVVTQCGCGTADKLKAEIQKMIDSGMTQDQIIKSYTAKYGDTVLAAPPKKGFSLTAWLLPFFGFAGGFAMLTFFLKRQKEEPAQEESTEPTDDRYRKEFEQELEQLK